MYSGRSQNSSAHWQFERITWEKDSLMRRLQEIQVSATSGGNDLLRNTMKNAAFVLIVFCLSLGLIDGLSMKKTKKSAYPVENSLALHP